MDKKTKGVITFLAYALTGSAMTALTACAEKVNLISSRLTPFATAALVAVGLIELAAMKLTSHLIVTYLKNDLDDAKDPYEAPS